MKRHLFGTVSALLVVGMMAGCATDPTQDLRGGVVTVLVSRTFVDLNVGQVLRMNAKALDAQGNVLPILPTIATSDEAVVSFIIDDTTSGDPLPETDFQITAVSPGSATITATAGGVTSDATLVLSFPTSFPGAVATTASGHGWDVVTISATASVKFDPDNTTATIAGAEAYIHSITADELQLVHSTTDAVANGTVVITNLVFLDEYDIASLSTTASVAAFTDYLTDDPTTAPEVTGPFPLHVYGTVTSAADLRYLKVTAGGSALALASTLLWRTGADLDAGYYDNSLSWVDCLGCGGSNPEVGEFTIPAGESNYYEAYLWSGDDTLFQLTLSEPPAP
jgi:hypothetical protein